MKWICTKERLPEKDGEYLVSISEMEEYGISKPYVTTEDFKVSDGAFIMGAPEFVTHWMEDFELPNPYEYSNWAANHK